jgi:hypothetical protein
MDLMEPVKLDRNRSPACSRCAFCAFLRLCLSSYRKREYSKTLNLPRGQPIQWINERTFDVQELSSFAWPIVYRVTTADGYSQQNGKRVYFTPEIEGLSTQKKVSDVVVRLAVFPEHHRRNGVQESELVNGRTVSGHRFQVRDCPVGG